MIKSRSSLDFSIGEKNAIFDHNRFKVWIIIHLLDNRDLKFIDFNLDLFRFTLQKLLSIHYVLLEGI